MKPFGIITLLLLASSLVYASAYNQLSGTYRIGGKTLYDPPENEPQNTNIYFELSGSAAKDLYQTMAVKPQKEVCGETGTQTKTIGNMQCTLSSGGKEYRCWFGIDVKSQKIVSGVVC